MRIIVATTMTKLSYKEEKEEDEEEQHKKANDKVEKEGCTEVWGDESYITQFQK